MGFSKVSRRKLLLALGAVGLSAGGAGLYFVVHRQREKRWAKAVERDEPFTPNVYLAIEADGAVIIWLTKTEMGQGVMTALPMLLAEELDADWNRVEVRLAQLDAEYDYGSMFTAASGSVSGLWTELRQAGAAAREMLLEAGASHLGVSESECTTREGQVIHGVSNRSVSYGEIVEDAARLAPPLRPTLKDPSSFRIIGQSPPRVEIPSKVRGEAVFGIDARPQDALVAAVLRAPVYGGKLKSADVQAAEKMPGVSKVLLLKSFVAVVADSTWAAFQGIEQLKATWILPEYRPSSVDIVKKLSAALDSPGVLVHESGDAKIEPDSLQATYDVPFLAHAPMEPLNSAVEITESGCQIWVPTQNPDGVRAVAANTLGIPLESVVVHRTLVGGGFGRRTNTDETEEAVLIARALKRPVRLVWTREDDIKHDFYREAAAHRFRGALSQDGLRLKLFHRIASASPQENASKSTTPDNIAIMGSTDVPYNLESSRVEWSGVTSPVRVGILRSVGYSHNTFALESFVDEIAHKNKLDPLELRLKLLPEDSRLRACLEKVAKLSDWTNSGARPLGVAVCSCFGSHIALIVETSVDERASASSPPSLGCSRLRHSDPSRQH